jgi:hypothetical protein
MNLSLTPQEIIEIRIKALEFAVIFYKNTKNVKYTDIMSMAEQFFTFLSK